MTFKPAVQVDLLVDNGWTEITDDTYTRDPITIGRGRANEASRVEASKCSVTLDNRDGRYSPRNPASPYFGKIGRNTPIRVQLPGGEHYLDLPGGFNDRAQTVDHASLDITGDIDIRMELVQDIWPLASSTFRALASKSGTSTETSWRLRSDTSSGTRRLTFTWSVDGTATLTETSANLPDWIKPGERFSVRVTFDVNDGAGNRVTRFYVARHWGDEWELYDTNTTAGTTSIFASNANLWVGKSTSEQLDGRVYHFELRNGIDGTVVANPDFTAQAVGAASFVDAAGRTWTFEDAATIGDYTPRFVGEVAAWPQRWDKPGKDVHTPIEAAGIMRRLGQGASPLQSAARRAIPTTNPVAYWPLTDGEDAKSAAPVIGTGVIKTYLAGATVQFAQTTPVRWLEPLPAFDGTLKGPVSMSNSATEWGIGALFIPGESTPEPSIAALYDEPADGDDYMLMGVFLDTPGVEILRSYWNFHPDVGAGTGADFDWNAPGILDGEPHFVELRVFQNGANIEHEVYMDGDLLTLSAGTGVITSRTLRGVDVAYVGGKGGEPLGHFAVWDDLAAMGGAAQAALGYPGEAAGRRVERLCSEEGVAFTSVGNLDDTAAMGPQPIDTFLELARECADTDLGILYEPRDTLGLAYRTRTSMYNQAAALALPYVGVFGSLPEPIDDDQAVRNDVTVKRPDGQQSQAVLETGALSVLAPPDGVGRYDDSVEVNVVGDEFLAQQASWRLALGTVDEARFPRLHVNLAAPVMAASASLTAATAALDVGDRVTVSDPPTWLPPNLISQLAQGFTETIGSHSWDIEINASPESPWQVGQYEAAEGETYRYDTAGSSLAAQFIAGTNTSMSVAVDIKPLWTTDGDEVPFDIEVGGVRLTVTAISGASSPQTFTITQTPVNGITKTIPAGTSVSLWTKARYAL